MLKRGRKRDGPTHAWMWMCAYVRVGLSFSHYKHGPFRRRAKHHPHTGGGARDKHHHANTHLMGNLMADRAVNGLPTINLMAI